MKFLSQELWFRYHTYQPKGWKGAIKPIWQIVIGAVLLTCVVSIICFLVIRKKSKKVNTDPSANKNSRKVSAVKKGCVMLSGIVVLSSLIFVVIGALPPSDINDISPAIGARLKIASYFVFDTKEVVRVYTMPTTELLQTDLSQLQDALSKDAISQETETFAAFRGEKTSMFFESDLLQIDRATIYEEEAVFDTINAKSLNIDGKESALVRNRYLFVCRDNPKYTMILYDTDIGYIVALYGMIEWDDVHSTYNFNAIWYFKYEDFARYAQRDLELIKEAVDKLEEEGEWYEGPGFGYQDPAGYNPLNVTLITEEKSWNNSHEAILYIIACAILHVALVCAIWYGGYRLYQKKRRSTPPADPNTEEAPKSGTE